MRKLGWITVGFTYLLMVWGNMVSATGSGLACPDWPLCHGTVAPPISFSVILEWGHRLLAATTSVLIISTIVAVLRTPASTMSSGHANAMKKSGRSLLLLLAIQIPLGGLTVMLGLSIIASTVHLMIAHVVFAGLITVASVITWKDPAATSRSPKVGRLALAGLLGLAIQIALGGMVRHGHAGLACPNFPNCLDGFWPLPFGFETAVAFLHRWWGILLLGLFVHLFVAAARQAPSLARVSRSVMFLAIAQVCLGIGTVLGGLHVHTRGTHAAIGYLLWGMLSYIAVRSGAFRFLYQYGPIDQTKEVTRNATAQALS